MKVMMKNEAMFAKMLMKMFAKLRFRRRFS